MSPAGRAAVATPLGVRRGRALGRLAAWVALALASVGCPARPAQPRRIMAEEALLRRQIADLGTLVTRAEQGSLLPTDKLVVAVSEQLVKDLAQLALPREQIVAKSFRVRLERADIRFRDKHGSVRLEGRVTRVAQPDQVLSEQDVYAELAVLGLIDSVELDRESGVLRGRVEVIGFEVQRVAVFGDSETARLLLEEFGQQKLETLQDLARPITIPVQLEQAITFKGVQDGPVRLQPRSFPLSVSVADVAAHGERLWVTLAVESGQVAIGAPATPALAGTR